MANGWRVTAHVDLDDVLDLATPAHAVLAGLSFDWQWAILRDEQHHYALTRKEIAALIGANRRLDTAAEEEPDARPLLMSDLLGASGFPPALVVDHDVWFREIAGLSGEIGGGDKLRIIARVVGAPLVIWARTNRDYSDLDGVSPGATRPPRPITSPVQASQDHASDSGHHVSKMEPSSPAASPARKGALGTVKWFNATKGFGFIGPDDRGADVVVHVPAVRVQGSRSLKDGQRIGFERPLSAPSESALPPSTWTARPPQHDTGHNHVSDAADGRLPDDAELPDLVEMETHEDLLPGSPSPDAGDEPISMADQGAIERAGADDGSALPTSAIDGPPAPVQAAEDEAQATRWVNAEIEDHAAAEPLVIAQTYTLAIGIDAAQLQSAQVVGRVRASRLTQDPDNALLLSVSLSSNDFTIGDPQRRLKIGKDGLSAGKARFDIAPIRAGLGRLTAILHRDNNFVQRLDISLQVGPGVTEPASVVSTGRAIATSRNLLPRNFTMMIQPSPTGGFDCLAWGAASAQVKLPIKAAELEAEIEAARAALLRVVKAKGKDGKRPFQTGVVIEEGAVRDKALKTIAMAGYTLFQKLFFHPASDRQCQALGEWLIEQINETPDNFKLQIVARDFPVPWAMLYLAPEWADDAIEFERFLGMKLVIEQVPLCNDRYDRDPRIPGHPGGLSVSLNLNTDLDEQISGGTVAAQERYWNQVVSACPAIRLRKRTQAAELVEALNDATTDDQIVYFFCHAESIGLKGGGPGSSNLTLSDNSSLDLATLAVRAPSRRKLGGEPLVIINACESGKLSPLFYNGFVPYFLSKGACGVIGTECKVPGRFAAAWAEEFFDDLLAGKPVGETVRLLSRNFYLSHGNPLGLLYGLHCSADTQIDPLPLRQNV